MKLTSAICVAILAYGVNSSAVANPAPEANAVAEPEPFCWRPGQPCAKAKRAADAMAAAFAEPAASVDKRSAEAVAEAEAFCWRPGQPCAKAKRDAEAAPAISKRAAEAEAEAFCWRPGQPCAKAKRAAEAEAEAEAFCWRPGQPCAKAKRDALALASAVSEATPDAHIYYDQLKVREAFPEPEENPVPGEYRKPVVGLPESEWPAANEWPGKAKRAAEAEAEAEAFCWRPGQPCAKAKRSAEAVSEALAEPAPVANNVAKRDPEAEAFCWRPGQPCAKAKRNAFNAASAARDSTHEGLTKRFGWAIAEKAKAHNMTYYEYLDWQAKQAEQHEN